jgi:ABC-type sulfate/molybdate transport systems ATPase subunit
VFQNYALFNHMAVADNIGFGLRVRRQDRRTVRTAVDRPLAIMHLEGLGNRLPAQLSGG